MAQTSDQAKARQQFIEDHAAMMRAENAFIAVLQEHLGYSDSGDAEAFFEDSTWFYVMCTAYLLHERQLAPVKLVDIDAN